MHAAIGSPITLENPCAVTGIPFGAMAEENCVAVAATPTTTRLRSVVMATLDPDPTVPHIAVGTTCTTPELICAVVVGMSTAGQATKTHAVEVTPIIIDPTFAAAADIFKAELADGRRAAVLIPTTLKATSAVAGIPFRVLPTESVRVVAAPRTIRGNKDAAVVASPITGSATSVVRAALFR